MNDENNNTAPPLASERVQYRQIICKNSKTYVWIVFKDGIPERFSTDEHSVKGIRIVDDNPDLDREGYTDPKKGKRPVNYLSNASLMEEIQKSKDKNKITDKLVMMLDLLTYRISKRHNFSGYTWDLREKAFYDLIALETWRKFNPEKSDNPFSFISTCVINSMIQVINTEKRQLAIQSAAVTREFGVDVNKPWTDTWE